MKKNQPFEITCAKAQQKREWIKGAEDRRRRKKRIYKIIISIAVCIMIAYICVTYWEAVKTILVVLLVILAGLFFLGGLDALGAEDDKDD